MRQSARGRVLLCCLLLSGCASGGSPAAAPSSALQPDPAVSDSTVADAPTDAALPTAAPQPRPTRTVIQAQPRPAPPATQPPTTQPASPSSAPPPPQRVVYAFPIDPPSVASYGREHHDYPATDIFAPCGVTVVAPTAGVVQEVSRMDRWDPAVNDPETRGGLSVSIVGDDGVRYYGSHYASIRRDVVPGLRVVAGTRLGRVGRSGNARETPCHLHFGLSPPRGPGDWEVRRGVLYPWPYLDSWGDGGHRSPRRAIQRWAARNPA